MASMISDLQLLPQRIRERFELVTTKLDGILSEAQAFVQTDSPTVFSVKYQSAGLDQDMLSDYERAQSISFVTRYEHLPSEFNAVVAQVDGVWVIRDLWALRHVINDFRPIIYNQQDAVHYQNVHNQWYRMLTRSDPSQGMTIRLFDRDRTEVTTIFAKMLGERNKAIRHVVESLEFDYLYNGFLQHSDKRFTSRYLRDYVSGELNYLLWKHVRPLNSIYIMLEPYHMLMRSLTFPQFGNL